MPGKSESRTMLEAFRNGVAIQDKATHESLQVPF